MVSLSMVTETWVPICPSACLLLLVPIFFVGFLPGVKVKSSLTLKSRATTVIEFLSEERRMHLTCKVSSKVGLLTNFMAIDTRTKEMEGK